MLTIYSEHTSPRLEYICNVLFKEQLGIDYTISNNADSLEGNFIINYSTQRLSINAFQIIPHGLLFENKIHEQEIDIFRFKSFIYDNKKTTAFFAIPSSNFPFDIFSAAFYLLSRYEEYLPYEKDSYGRFYHKQSLAYQNDFLEIPLVNIWIQEFKKVLSLQFENLECKQHAFKTILSYDIDIAWSYKNKGFFRNIGGFLINPDIKRLKVILGLKKDPFDAYEFLDGLHKSVTTEIIYFFLVAQSISKYDKNISPENKQMKELIQSTSSNYKVGLHPSWKSNNYQTILNNEKVALENISGKNITDSRQHYIQFRLPDTYEHLIKAGIQNDYSMGYGSINGFRASFAGSFYWYHLKEEKTTSLRLFPFCFMDANSFYEQYQDAETSFQEIMHLKNECEKVNGLFISIFHNNFLGTDKRFAGWATMYAAFISQLR
jgi:hypothetical protein